jgi:hypothetical protein
LHPEIEFFAEISSQAGKRETGDGDRILGEYKKTLADRFQRQTQFIFANFPTRSRDIPSCRRWTDVIGIAVSIFNKTSQYALCKRLATRNIRLSRPWAHQLLMPSSAKRAQSNQQPLDEKNPMTIRRDWQYIPPYGLESSDAFDDLLDNEAAADPFSLWLEERLEELEERHSEFRIRKPVIIVLITYCHGGP